MEELDAAYAELEARHEDPVTLLMDPSLMGENIEATEVYNLAEFDRINAGTAIGVDSDSIGVHEGSEPDTEGEFWSAGALLAERGLIN